ncbi:MAG: hypothetical protein NVSMB21_16990 [Vulcanimicrobiaceae bacterium]
MFAKKAFVQRFASVRFDGVLVPAERDVVTRAVASCGATATSWAACGSRTYATLSLSPACDVPAIERAIASGRSAVRVDAPPLVVLRVAPSAPRLLGSLGEALGGPGRPAGVRDARRVDDALVVECDPRVTPLATLVALIDVELASAPGRSIDPLVPLDDETLVAFAAALLCEPDLDCRRLIEPHLARVSAR